MSYSFTIPGTPYDDLDDALAHAIEQLPEDSAAKAEALSHRAAVDAVLAEFCDLVGDGGTFSATVSGHGHDGYTSVTVQVSRS